MRLNSPKQFAKPLATIAIALCVIAALLAAPATAAITERGFSWAIAASEELVKNPTDPMVKKRESWDTSMQRIMGRNMPFLEITNLDYSTGNLLQMNITIGDTRFNFSDNYFGSLVQPGKGVPVGAIESATTTDGDALNIVFGNGGLAPGESITFRIDIGADTTGLFQSADYRTVLFDMNGVQVYDGGITMVSDADNSELTGLFVDPSDPTMTATASLRMQDYDVDDGSQNFFNQNRRPYSTMEMMNVFGGQVDPIPEPTSIALLGVAGAAILVACRRKRFVLLRNTLP